MAYTSPIDSGFTTTDLTNNINSLGASGAFNAGPDNSNPIANGIGSIVGGIGSTINNIGSGIANWATGGSTNTPQTMGGSQPVVQPQTQTNTKINPTPSAVTPTIPSGPINSVAAATAAGAYDAQKNPGSYAQAINSGETPSELALNAQKGISNTNSGVYNQSNSSTGDTSTGFNPNIPTTLGSDATSSGLTYNDVLNARQQLMQEYAGALSNYANTQTNSQLQNLNAQYSGDTTNFGNSAGALSQMETGIKNQNALLQANNYGTLLGANATTAQLIPGQYQTVQPGNTLVGIGSGTPSAVYGGLGQGTNGTSGTQTLQSLAQVANTQGWNAAVSMLGSYASDPNTVNQLYQAANQYAQQNGQTFNINQSNAIGSSQNTNTQTAGQLNTQVSAANQALSTLQTAQNALSGIQNTGIPYVSAITTDISSKLGSTSATNYNAVIADARTQVANALASAGLTTPSNSATVAEEYLPNGMTTAQLNTNIGIIKTLLNQKLSALNAGGTSNTNTSQSGTSGVNYNF